ncbi:MAG TPA: MscL family protein [Candidatus Saccharimonadales bacterium]|nr:MscL family protein [Candidatus Saccharimonadales bacterium]
MASTDAEKEREVKEVATKLRHLGPAKQAEVVNELIAKQVTRQLGGFTDFLREQSVIGIGIGLVLGTQLKTVVDSITQGLINPLTSLFLPGEKTLTEQSWTINAIGRTTTVNWGSIVYQLFDFVLVAFIIYAIFKLLKLDKLTKKK